MESERTMPVVERYLIVNADDFGMSAGVNGGVIEAHERGIVTSASLMVSRPGATAAAAYARTHPDLSLGLHFELGEWAREDGSWYAVRELADPGDGRAVAVELERQMAVFRRLAGLQPTHLDSHQHVHRYEPVRSILIECARELAVPLRSCSPAVGYCGEFYGQTGTGERFPDGISVERLVGILKALPRGFTELACHPGRADGLESAYGAERAREVQALCDPRVRAAIVAQRIELRSFNDVSGAEEARWDRTTVDRDRLCAEPGRVAPVHDA